MTQIGDELKEKTEPLTSTMPQLCWLGLSWIISAPPAVQTFLFQDFSLLLFRASLV